MRHYHSSPFGMLCTTFESGQILRIEWIENSDEQEVMFDEQFGAIELTVFWREWFVSPVPCPFPLRKVGTPFQNQVWNAISEIPIGKTESYQEVGRRIGYTKGMQAIGQACKANPFPLVIPCHRVVGSTGALTGYVGSKHVEIKQNLLQWERSLF